MEWTIKEGYYISTVEDITVMIRKDHLSKNTHIYALRIASLYKENEETIFRYVAEAIAQHNKLPSINESIREKMTSPHIKIFNEGKGIIIWINFLIDNKTVTCKFENDMNLLGVEVIPEN